MDWTAPLTALALVIAWVVFSFLNPRSTATENVYDLGGIPIINSWGFFTRRYDFFRNKFKESGGRAFRFKVLQHRVLAMRGENARKAFFNHGALNPNAGYKILMGGGPTLQEVGVDTGGAPESEAEGFIKRLLPLIRKERIADTLPTLLEDLSNRMRDWGTEGKINPFKEVYDLVFQVTVRMGTCEELSKDRKTIDQLAENYWTLEKSATPVAMLLPWFRGAAKKAQETSSLALYNLINHFVQLRRKASAPTTDPIDSLIRDGHSDDAIISTVIGILFVGVFNTGLNACWILLYLGLNPQWKEKVALELKELVARHTDPTSSEPLHKRLSAILFNAWEEELPITDLVIRETLRLTVSFAVIRRNVREDIDIQGIPIKHGDFVAYQLYDTHMDPNIYLDPTKFDPDRYSEGRHEDRKETFAYLAWGAGRHPCAGMRLAKLEIKIILALILLGLEYELVDSSGMYPTNIPIPDRNGIQQARPLGEPCFMKFKRTVD